MTWHSRLRDRARTSRYDPQVGRLGRTVLVLDDKNGGMAPWRQVKPTLDLHWSSSLADALAFIRAMRTDDVAFAVFDVRLSPSDRGTGLDALEAFRACAANAPAIVVSALRDIDLERIHRYGASVVHKPITNTEADTLAKQLTTVRVQSPVVREAVEMLAAHGGLSLAELRLLVAAANGVPRWEAPDYLGISNDTLYSQLRRLGEKPGLGGITRYGALLSLLFRVLATGRDALPAK